MTVMAQVDLYKLFEEKTARELLLIALSKLSSYVDRDNRVKYALNTTYWIHNAIDVYAYTVFNPPRSYLKIVATTRDGLILEVHWYEDNTLYYEIHSTHSHSCDCNCGE